MIFAEHDRGSSQRAIGGLLGRPASTICRELARGRQDDGSYCPQAARLVYDVRRRRCRRQRKLAEGGDIHRFVHDSASTVGDLIAELAARSERHAAAFADPASVRVALDQQLSDFAAPIAGVSEIAFFPPMTGG